MSLIFARVILIPAHAPILEKQKFKSVAQVDPNAVNMVKQSYHDMTGSVHSISMKK